MSNSFGKIFRLITWGESHGEAIGAVIDGCPSGIALSEKDIQPYLDLRRPGQSKFTTQRQEEDRVKIMSGVFHGVTTGSPISLIIQNQDQRSRDYGDIAEKFRPGHADYVYQMKYGIRDHRGSGRASARETAMRVAGGAIARKVIERHEIEVLAYLTQMGDIKTTSFLRDEIHKNSFFCPDSAAAIKMAEYLSAIRKDGSSVGAIVEVVANNVPVGLGEPIYGKLDSDLASALMSINAVKAVEIGDGFKVASMRGEDNADEMWIDEQKTLDNIEFYSNHAGGILGGISTGQEIVARFAVKPTSSILKPKRTVNLKCENDQVITTGRHDPCVGIRAVPVAEAMMALVLADHLLISGKFYEKKH